MTTERVAEYGAGRRFLARLADADLLSWVSEFCRTRAIRQATFQVVGSVSRFTLGVYDPTQQVYVTHAEEAPREVASCAGFVSAGDGDPVAAAHAVLVDARGEATGGRLFSETRLIWGELVLRELDGPDLARRYDPATGLDLWVSAEWGNVSR